MVLIFGQDLIDGTDVNLDNNEPVALLYSTKK